MQTASNAKRDEGQYPDTLRIVAQDVVDGFVVRLRRRPRRRCEPVEIIELPLHGLHLTSCKAIVDAVCFFRMLNAERPRQCCDRQARGKYGDEGGEQHGARARDVRDGKPPVRLYKGLCEAHSSALAAAISAVDKSARKGCAWRRCGGLDCGPDEGAAIRSRSPRFVCVVLCRLL